LPLILSTWPNFTHVKFCAEEVCWCRVAACLHRFGDCAASLCDVAEGLRSSVEIVDNLNMAIPYIAAEPGFIDAVFSSTRTARWSPPAAVDGLLKIDRPLGN
jgi:hypothetical protein